MPAPNQEQLAILAQLDFAILRPYFYLPLSKVAVEFGVCATVLKKRCRDLGVKRWPFRKIRSLRRSIAKPNCTEAERAIMEEQIESIHDEMSHVAAVSDHSKAAVLLMEGAPAPAWRRANATALAPAALWSAYIEPTVPLKNKRKKLAPAVAGHSSGCDEPQLTATATTPSAEAECDDEERPCKRARAGTKDGAVPSFAGLADDIIMSLNTPMFMPLGHDDDADSAAASDHESEMSLSDHEDVFSAQTEAELEFGNIFNEEFLPSTAMSVDTLTAF